MNEKKTQRKPISNDTIYKIMLIMAFSVSALFLLKDLFSNLIKDAIVVGTCLSIFSISIILMHKFNVAKEKKQFLVSLFIVFLVFIISINSGNYYSDDFPLYLAVIGLSGLYMNPTYTITQMILIDIFLFVAYFIHPEKADPFGQYTMCIMLFSIAAYTFFMVIKRGNAYIELSENKINEANKLLASIKSAGIELQQNCEHSSDRIYELNNANSQLKEQTIELEHGSKIINNDTKEVVSSFDDVKNRMLHQEASLNELNNEVKTVESSLSENKEQLSIMSSDIQSVNKTFSETNEVFETLQDNITNIIAVTKQLSNIAYNTTILALNASIEAARAGEAGNGFAIVAANVQDLAKDSTECAEEVFEVVENMTALINKTSSQLVENKEALNTSVNNFESLYSNIETQNEDAKIINKMLEDLKLQINNMSDSSLNNQQAVSSITDTMHVYEQNINSIINETQQINDLSNLLLNIANSQ